MTHETLMRVLLGVIILIVFVAVLGFILIEDTQGGVVDTKWSESSLICDNDGDCRLTVTYFVRLRDGRVFTMFWGAIPWWGLESGQYIALTARGYRLEFYGIRIFTPSLMEYTILEDNDSR